MAAAASRHHCCSGHLPGTREDSRGKGGGLSHCRPICHEVKAWAQGSFIIIFIRDANEHPASVGPCVAKGRTLA
eukprot:scaffold4407_cov123-Isochrysis_galbana.AAC.1